MNFEYMNAIMDFLKKELKDNPNENWVSFSNDLKKLVDEISLYNDNDKIADKEALKNVDKLFKDAIKSADIYLKTPFDENNPNEAVRHNMTKKLNDEFLAKLYVDFSNVEANKNIKESLDKFRTLPIKVTEDEIKNVGGNLSSRTKLSLDIDGKKVSGVFTPTTSFDSSKAFKNILDGIIKKYPRYEEYFSKLNTRDGIYRYTNIDIHEVFTADGRLNTASMRTFGNYAYVPNDVVPTFNKFKDDDDFLAANLELIVKSNKFGIGHSINTEVLELQTGDNIDKRNSAMSGIAHMLNIDNILAKSRPITIERTIDGKKVFFEGTFMEEAKGKDLTTLTAGDEVYDMNAKNLDSPLGKKALADLQVIDYICGNVDRHAGNIFYQFDPKTKKLIGVQGIDNDASFFKRNPRMGDYKHLFVDIPKMKVVDAEMAQKVLLLEEAPFKATLMGYGLKNDEINAAWERTIKLQEALKNAAIYGKGNKILQDENTVTIVNSEDWDSVKYDDLADINGSNIFRRTRAQFSNLSGKMLPDNEKRLNTVAKFFAYKSKLGYAEKYLAEARRNSNLFGTSTRFKNIIKGLEALNNENDINKKFKNLDRLESAIDVYKAEKIKDEFLDKDGNIIKDVTGKALNRINLVKELEDYVKIVKLLRQDYLDAESDRLENEKYVDEFNALHRKDKYANYPKAIKNEDGKIVVDSKIYNRDEQFKEVMKPLHEQMEAKAASGYRSNNEALVNEANKLDEVINKEIKNMKDVLTEEFHNNLIPMEYYNARIKELDNRAFDNNMNELFTTNNNEFQDNLKEDINEDENIKNDINVENNEVENNLEK